MTAASRRTISTIGAGVLLLAAASHAFAQHDDRPPAKYYVELETRNRWMNARQLPQFTEPVFSRTWINIEAVAVDSTAKSRTFRLWLAAAYDAATLTTTLDGRPRQFAESSRWSACRIPDSTEFERLSVGWGDVQLTPSGSATQEIAPSFHPARVERGAHWTDTIHWSHQDEWLDQALDGVRTSTIERDTMVGGRRLWIVRDSAYVRYTDHCPIEEEGFMQPAIIERRVDGPIEGRYLYDPATSLFRTRADTMTLRGEALLIYPDGRRFPSATTFEQSRRWTTYVPSDYVRRVAALAAANWRADVAPIDSDNVRATANTRQRVMNAVFANGARRYSVADIELLIPFMESPGLAFDFNIPRDIYGSVEYALTTWPPALTRDSAKSGCEPAACELLGKQWTVSHEERLKSLGLVALTMSDPKRWEAELRARAARSGDIAQGAMTLVAGIGSTHPLAMRLPVPDSGADWRVWHAWLGMLRPGTESDARWGGQPAPPWTNAYVNTSGIRFREFVSGRNIGAELKHLLAREHSDTARFVLLNILGQLGELELEDSLPALVTSGSSLLRRMASRAIEQQFSSKGDSADSELTGPLQSRLLEATLTRRAPWPKPEWTPDSTARKIQNVRPDSLAGVAPMIYLDSTTVEATLLPAWRSRVVLEGHMMSDSTTSLGISERWHISKVARTGQLARVSIEVTAVRPPGRPGPPTRQYREYTLLFHEGDWVIVTIGWGTAQLDR